MSTIRFNIENFVSKETILDLNSIVNCIVNCGNDHLIIDTSKYSGIDLSNFIEFIKDFLRLDYDEYLKGGKLWDTTQYNFIIALI